MKNVGSLPLMRRDDLIVKDLEHEVLVYDCKRKRALCLNYPSAVVWKMCDGATDLAGLTKRARTTLPVPVDEAFVSYALERLAKDDLLVREYTAPAGFAGMSRQELMRRAGLTAALALPLVTAIVAPSAAKAYGRGGRRGHDHERDHDHDRDDRRRR